MKKISFLFIVIIFLLTGCNNGKLTFTCNIKTIQEANGYTLTSKYKVYSKNNIVTKVVINEVIKTDNEKIIDSFKSILENQYKGANDKYGGYTYKIKKEKGKLISSSTMNFKKMNMKSFITDNNMKEFSNKDNQITIKKMKEYYEGLGAKCK